MSLRSLGSETIRRGETEATAGEEPEEQAEVGYDPVDEISPVLAQVAHT